MAGAGSATAPGPFNFAVMIQLQNAALPRRSWRTACNRAQPPAAAPNSTSRAPARATESPKLSLPGAAPGRLSNFHFLGSWQTSNALALQANSCGSVTRRLNQFNCGENEIQASLISSASVGATPTPATNSREVSRLPVCKTGVTNNCRKRRLEHYQHLPPIRIRSSISGAARCLREG
jgi:hypothetical protein